MSIREWISTKLQQYSTCFADCQMQSIGLEKLDKDMKVYLLTAWAHEDPKMRRRRRKT